MKTDVFYVTYLYDYSWFEASLKLLQKNLSGYDRVIVVCSIEDFPSFSHFASSSVVVKPIPMWPGRGYFWQQWVKMRASLFSNADRILHIDSDVFILEPVSVDDFTDSDKRFFWAKTRYSELPSEVPWKSPTEKALMSSIDYEFMRCFPFLIPLKVHNFCSELIGSLHKKSIQDYIRDADLFSEFNVLGAVAEKHFASEFVFVDPSELPPAFSKVKQFWSHGDFPTKELESIL